MLRQLLFAAAVTLYIIPTPVLLGQDTTLPAQGDSVVAVDPPADQAGNPLDWGKAELLKWAIPLVGAFLFKQWNKVNGWLSEWANPLKMALYILLITGAMLLGEFLHMSISQNPADWGGAFWEGIAGGLLGTLLTKIGINTAREKSPSVARA